LDDGAVEIASIALAALEPERRAETDHHRDANASRATGMAPYPSIIRPNRGMRKSCFLAK
jgi:hypothetical protein